MEDTKEEQEFPIAVDWGECRVVKIKATTIEKAIEIVEKDCVVLLPEGEYIDDSFAVNRQMTNYLIREAQKEKEREEQKWMKQKKENCKS